MRNSVVRRLLAVLAVVVGLGVASAAAPAVASPASHQTVVSPASDWWWD
jgi:hypothetical protein